MADTGGGGDDRDAALAAVLGATGADAGDALDALDAAGGSVDGAVAALLGTMHGGPGVSGEAGHGVEGGAGDAAGAGDRQAPSPPLLDDAPIYIRAPALVAVGAWRLAWTVVGVSFSLLGSIVWPFLSAAGLAEWADPAAAAAEAAPRFIAEYADAYPDVARPEWLEMTFERATATAARQMKFLFVYLHTPSHEDTDSFVTEVLADPGVLAELSGDNFVPWGCDTSSVDGSRLVRALRRQKKPTVAIMLTLDSRAVLVGMSDARGGVEGLRAVMASAVADHSAELVAARHDASERDFARTLREEQDAALAASLRDDQEKAERRQREEAERRAEEERVAREEAEAQAALEAEKAAIAAEEAAVAAREAEVARRQEEKQGKLGDEPAPGTPGVAMVAVRFPDGGRRQRRFMAKDTVQRVYDFCDAEGMPFGKYTLVCSYPKKELGEDSLMLTLEDAGLSPKAMLMVRQDDE